MRRNMLKSRRKRGAECRVLNDEAIRRAMCTDCSVSADMVGPGMNSSTITSRSATCSSTRGPMPVSAAAFVL